MTETFPNPPQGYMRFNTDTEKYGYESIPIPDDAKFKPGDRVKCIETFISRVVPDTDMGIKGFNYTVEAVLASHGYLSLKESPGWVNASRFQMLDLTLPEEPPKFLIEDHGENGTALDGCYADCSVCEQVGMHAAGYRLLNTLAFIPDRRDLPKLHAALKSLKRQGAF